MPVLSNKLAMIILVKNEADIVELNVRFHMAMGVSKFLVMDNGSTDGTLEILKALKNDCELEIVENPDGVYQQSKWMTQLARSAAKRFGVSYIIPNDADEFWVPENGDSLPESIDESASVQTVHRVNRVLTADQVEQNAPIGSSEYYVNSPILYSGESQKNDNRSSMQLVKISPKVIVQPSGLIKIKGGNHRADHWKVWRKKSNSSITVHHFPIRSYQQFKANIKNRDALLDRPGVKMGPHYRRWVRQYRANMLKDEFNHLCLSAHELGTLESIGVLSLDKTLPATLNQIHSQLKYSN